MVWGVDFRVWGLGFRVQVHVQRLLEREGDGVVDRLAPGELAFPVDWRGRAPARKLCISHRAKTLYFTSGKSSVFHIGRKRCISHRVKTLYFTSGGERAGDIQARFRVSELPPWRLDLAHDRVEGAHELLAVHLYRPVQFSI